MVCYSGNLTKRLFVIFNQNNQNYVLCDDVLGKLDIFKIFEWHLLCMLPAVEWSKKWTVPLKGIKTRDHPNHGDEKFEALCDVCTGCQLFFHINTYAIYNIHIT